jgi:hypothetical protein
VLEQAKLIEDMLRARAAFEPGTYRVGLAELRRRTGLDFDHLVPNELPLSDSGLDQQLASRVRVRHDYSNLVL